MPRRALEWCPKFLRVLQCWAGRREGPQAAPLLWMRWQRRWRTQAVLRQPHQAQLQAPQVPVRVQELQLRAMPPRAGAREGAQLLGAAPPPAAQQQGLLTVLAAWEQQRPGQARRWPLPR